MTLRIMSRFAPWGDGGAVGTDFSAALEMTDVVLLECLGQVGGYIPVRMPERVGAQLPECEYTLS